MARLTVPDLRKKAENAPLVMVTAYDWTFARLMDMADVDMVLVGDSLGMIVQGQEDTLPVTLDEMVYHTRCVSRALTKAHLVADLPFMSYQVNPEQALLSAGRLIQEGRAQSVKLEGGERSAAAVEKIVAAGIPVVGHVGLTPQSVHTMGGFRIQGRTADSAERVLNDALAIEAAGAFAIVLEGMPSEVAARITEAVHIPTIGIGAGVDCDGQVLVCTDLLGMNLSFKPKFVKRYAELETVMVDAIRQYATEVRERAFPTEANAYGMDKAPIRLARLY